MAGHGKRLGLNWSSPGNSKVFRVIFDSQNEGKSPDSMVRLTRDVSAALPLEYKKPLPFNTLTGLRPDESQKAIHLIRTMEDEYLDT
jgi:hypothetical protein